MKQKALIIGDEHTVGIEYTFDKLFDAQNITWFNESRAGIGNQYISASLFEFVYSYGAPDYVFLQFTGLNRVDLPFRKNIKIPGYELQKESLWHNWIGSKGLFGPWGTNKRANRLFQFMLDVQDHRSQHIESFRHIFSALSLCKNLNIRYDWTSFYDYQYPPNVTTSREGHAVEMPDFLDDRRHLGVYPLNYAYDYKDKILNNDVYADFINEFKDKFNVYGDEK